MNSSFLRLFSAAATLLFVSAGVATAQYNYWPMNTGGRWSFRNKATLQPVVMTVGATTMVNCLPATLLTIYKTDPTNYWAPGSQSNLHWYIRQEADGTIWAPAFYSVGLAAEFGQPRKGNPNVTHIVPASTETRKPYTLIRNSAQQQDAPYDPNDPDPSHDLSIKQKYIDRPPLQPPAPDLAPGPGCLTDPNPPAQANRWVVTYTTETVNTPAYSGTAVMAHYSEYGPGGVFEEKWWFANGIGPVKIQTVQQASVPINIELELVYYNVIGAAGVDPGVTFRDLLTARTGSLSSPSFTQWNSAYVSTTGRNAPGPSDVCLNPLNTWQAMHVDTYLTYLENWGTSCSTVPWTSPLTAGGLKRWDAWGQNYVAATSVSAAIGAPDPATRCAPTVSYTDTNGTPQFTSVQPNLWILYTQRQWGRLMKAEGCLVVSYFDQYSHAGSISAYVGQQSWTVSNGTPQVWTVSGSGFGNGTVNYSLFYNGTGTGRFANAQITPNLGIGLVQRRSGAVFGDVPPEAPYFDPANILYQRQISLGCTTEPAFCPQNKLSRGQMAVFIIRSIYSRKVGNPEGFTLDSTYPYFGDVPDSHPFFRYIQKMRELGITLGCGSGADYCPDVPIPNWQMMIFLGRSHKYVNYNNVSLPSCPYDFPCTSYFPDMQNSATDEWKWTQYLAYRNLLLTIEHTPECTTGLLCPNVEVRRGQKAIYITRAILGEIY